MNFIHWCFLQACERADYGKTFKTSTNLNKLLESGIPYIQEAQKNAGKFGVTRTMKDSVDKCINSLQAKKVAWDLINPKDTSINGVDIHAYNELEIYWDETVYLKKEEEYLTIRCKAKLDRMIINFNTKTVKIPDVKTTGHSVYLFQSSMEYYKYYRQGAFYIRAATQWLIQSGIVENIGQVNGWKFEFSNVVTETFGLYQAGVYKMNEYWLDKGLQAVKDGLQRIAHHVYTGDWINSMEEYNNDGYLQYKDSAVSIHTEEETETNTNN